MKNSLLLLALGLFGMILSMPISSRAQASIPNGGFEDWSGNYPAGWFVDNLGPDTPIMSTTDAHSGFAALYGSVIQLTTGGTAAPIAVSGSSFTIWGFPYTDRPKFFTGYFKYNGNPGDYMSISAGFMKKGMGIATAEFVNSIATNTYTQFRIPITFKASDTPDSAYVNIVILGPGGSTMSADVGSEMHIDDLAFTNAAAAVVEEGPASFRLEESVPNPSTSSATIGFTLESAGYTSLTIYNIAGEVIATPLKEYRNAGKYSVAMNTSSLPSATYWYRLCSGNKAMVRSMLVMH